MDRTANPVERVIRQKIDHKRIHRFARIGYDQTSNSLPNSSNSLPKFVGKRQS